MATPAMRQHARFKAAHPDCILFFRMGDFYEMFGDDAVTVHKALGLTLTERTSGLPMAGIPHHAAENYLRRLIEQGYRVAICDQVQDPKEAKGIVDRAVTRVLTPGTLIDETLLDESATCVTAAIFFPESGDNSPAHIAAVELSTGSFTLLSATAATLVDELARLCPSEILYTETADGALPPRVKIIQNTLDCPLTPRPGWSFRPADALQITLDHYGVQSLQGFGLEPNDPGISPVGALLRFLQETQSPDNLGDNSRLKHLQPPRRVAADQFVALDASSLRTLEIERTMRTGQTEGSLLSVLQHCRTPMGKRLLRQWLCFPLRDKSKIEARQQVVSALLNDDNLARTLTETLGPIQDIARMVGRLALRRATPRDLVALGKSAAQINPLSELLKDYPALTLYSSQLEEIAPDLATLSHTILTQCVESPPAHLREGGLFQDGTDAQLDEARLLQRDANAWLARYQKQLTEETNIPSLKIGFNKVFGYYIEVTHVHVEKVPVSFTRKQTLTNAERYITPELKEFEDKVTTAEARAIEREKLLFEKLCLTASNHNTPLTQYADLVAALDILGNFATLARRYHYVKPTLVEEPILDIKQGRHPVLDRMLGQQFVPNDCVLGSHEPCAISHEDEDSGETLSPSPLKGEGRGEGSGSGGNSEGGGSLALITGPNMAGKSTYIRQVALITLLAHTGCFVPAESATIGLTDRIFTRIGASDELHAGQSTFMVEMTETANILHHATNRSLVILDEIGRGTSTLDGLALAWAIAETVADRRCRTLFATHYHELTDLGDPDRGRPNVKNLHVAAREWNDEIIFIYRVMPGRTDKSYGIHVAKIAGLPPKTIKRASELLDSLNVHHEPATPVGRPSRPSTNSPPPSRRSAEGGGEGQGGGSGESDGSGDSGARNSGGQLNLFTEYLEHPLIETIRKINLDTITPLDAFETLRQLRKDIK